jgi:hypothetical protein
MKVNRVSGVICHTWWVKIRFPSRAGHFCEQIHSTGNPNPNFASFRGTFDLRTLDSKDISNLLFLVWLWFGGPHDEQAAVMMRTSEPPH